MMNAQIYAASLALLALAYLCGSLPFGVLLTRWSRGGDVRAQGSGNIGASNVLRSGRRGLALLTLMADLGKALPAVWLAAALAPGSPLAALAGLAAIGGHMFPVWLRFRGGKGVATFLGGLCLLSWPLALFYAGLWALIALVSRTASLASLGAHGVIAVAALVHARAPFLPASDAFLPWFVLAGLALSLWAHRANIERLRRGCEYKIGGHG